MAVAGSQTKTRLQLVHDPGDWTVALSSGDELSVSAHAYHEADDHYVFAMLMEGTPPSEIEVLRLPRSAVAGIRGG